MELSDLYFKELDIDPKSEKAKLKDALNRAYEQRSFEIEHLWKRGTFFWGFQAGIFTAFGLVWQKLSEAGQGKQNAIMLVALASLGILTSLANSLVVRGSKFWQENWERHIDMLENPVEGALYKTVWLQRGRLSFSVSGVGRVLADCFTAFWVFAGLYAMLLFLEVFSKWDSEQFRVYYAISVITITAFLVHLLRSQRTEFSGTLHRLDKKDTWGEKARSTNGLSFVVRDKP